MSLLSRHRQLAPSASVRVSPLCLGAMTFGDRSPEKYGKCSKEDAFAVLDHFYESGGNFIDTANVYQEGQSEQWVGEWMKARNCRDDIVLATKYTSTYHTSAGGKIASNYGGNGSKSMKRSIEASLEHLQTSYIDLFYLHWWDYTVSIPELMTSLNDLIIAGKVIYLGISDAPAWVVSKANQYARDHGLRQFAVYQGMWNASMRDFERDIIPMCHDEGMGLCPYGTLNQGRFQTEAGYKEREERLKEGQARNFIPLSEHDKNVARVLERIAEAKSVPLLHVALAYIFHKAPYVYPIVGARKLSHIQGSIDALSASLTDAEIEDVDNAYEFDPGFPHTFLSGTLLKGETPRGAYTANDVFNTKGVGTFDFVLPERPVTPGQMGVKK